jgi:CheY-like chemotaxis protein
VLLNAHIVKKRGVNSGSSAGAIEAREYSRSCRRAGAGLTAFGNIGDAMSEAAGYVVPCHKCQVPFDALQASFCDCLTGERSLACPSCGSCLCKAAPAVKSRFWSGAPKPLWDRKLEQRREQFVPPPNPAPAGVTRPLVLVVDDEKDIQRVAIRVIEGLGYGVVLATNGVEGLELAQRYQPDLVLTDALMPKLDGREMGRQIKENPATAQMKVVVMTALYTQIKYQTEAFRAYKVDDYLTKPLDVVQLRAVLEKHLGASSAALPGR